MSDIQNGTGTLKGISATSSAITMSGYATFLLKSVKAAHNFKLGEVMDAGDFDANLTATNEYIETTIDFTLSGATRAAAATTAVFPAPLATVTLANFKISLFNGDWIYVGGASIDLSNTEPATLTGLKIRKYKDATQNTSLTTIVTG